jgi:hypothetical protein
MLQGIRRQWRCRGPYGLQRRTAGCASGIEPARSVDAFVRCPAWKTNSARFVCARSDPELGDDWFFGGAGISRRISRTILWRSECRSRAGPFSTAATHRNFCCSQDPVGASGALSRPQMRSVRFAYDRCSFTSLPARVRRAHSTSCRWRQLLRAWAGCVRLPQPRQGAGHVLLSQRQRPQRVADQD